MERICNCTFSTARGQRDTPTSFDAEFQVHGAAWHLTDSRQIFEAMIGFDETANTQVVVTPGFNVNAESSSMDTCSASPES